MAQVLPGREDTSCFEGKEKEEKTVREVEKFVV